MFRTALCVLALLNFIAAPAFSQTSTVTFTPTELEIRNPERGYSGHLYGGEDLATFKGWMWAGANNGNRLGLWMIRLDDFRDRPLTPELLSTLERKFEALREAQMKVIIRFVYNYPTSSNDWNTPSKLQDAPLPIVLGHIEQLGAVIKGNRDTIVSMQFGFIGLWGEGHSSTNDLNTYDSEDAIREAIYANVPEDLPIAYRYPRRIMKWAQDFNDKRMGFHNDCYLSSADDVGTYWGSTTDKVAQRAFAAERTKNTFHSVETCEDVSAGARKTCAGNLAEGPIYHVSAMTGPGLSAADRAICEAEIKRKLGYRLELVMAKIQPRGSITLTIKNNGWAAPIQPRAIIVSAYSNGVLRDQTALTGVASSIEAGKSVDFSGVLASAPQSDRICISAPDSSDRLAKIPAYSIRFANADAGNQAWDATLGAFCFAVTKASDPGPADPEKLDPPPPSDPTPEEPIKPKRIKPRKEKVHERPD